MVEAGKVEMWKCVRGEYRDIREQITFAYLQGFFSPSPALDGASPPGGGDCDEDSSRALCILSNSVSAAVWSSSILAFMSSAVAVPSPLWFFATNSRRA